MLIRNNVRETTLQDAIKNDKEEGHIIYNLFN
jgi:hypothetical protein